MLFDLQPSLSSELLGMRPLREQDFDDLYAVAADPLIWEQHPDKGRYRPAAFRTFFQGALDSHSALVVVANADRRIIGSSRYHGYDQRRSEIEIGWTFLDRSHWGGRYNRELKRLMLRHAFGSVRNVVFVVGPDNLRSQRSVEKIGGARSGSRLDASGRESLVYRVEAASWADAFA